MTTITRILAAIFILGSSSISYAFDATFYLVRHAEKQNDGTHDPALTSKGVERAQTLANMLKGVQLDAIYSTNYKRTRATAAPTAIQAGLEVILYDPRPETFNKFIRDLKTMNGTFLIVGHSNTTPVVAGALAGQELAELKHHQYDHLYTVQLDELRDDARLSIQFIEPRTP